MNNNVLRLHDRKATNFETGDILHEAVNVSEQRHINDIACLQFDYPMGDKARLIKENMLLSCSGRIYEIIRITRTMDGRDIIQVVSEDMFSRRAKKAFLPNVPDMIGKTTSYVIRETLKKLSGDLEPQFSLYTDAELQELGMQWVGDDAFKIDFFSTDKTNLWDFLHTVIECSGRGEIYSNGMKFALVERIGRDNGVRLTLDHNMQNLNIERSTEDMITKLYPFGAEDLTIKHAKLANNGEYGKEYILSPNAAIYGIHEGCKDYSDYTEPEKVLAHALWEFNGETEDNIKPYGGAIEGVNEDRIDVPKLTISGNLIDLSKLEEYGDIMKVELGDTVHVYDLDGTEYVERVIEGTWYPFEAHESLISIGHMRRDMFFTLYQLRHAKRHLEAAQTANKSITTRKMQGVVNTDRNGVQSDNELLQMIGDLLTIYQQKNSNSKVKRLELGNVGGKFALNIYDETGKKLKIKLGDHGSNGDENYAFAIYDNDGKAVIFMDENGDVIFSGIVQGGKIESDTDINVTKDATVGRRIILQDKNEATAGYEEAAIISVSQGVMQILANNNRSINLHTDGNVNLNGKSIMVNGKEVATKADVESMIQNALDKHIRDYHSSES